jgi:hypothetical protein
MRERRQLTRAYVCHPLSLASSAVPVQLPYTVVFPSRRLGGESESRFTSPTQPIALLRAWLAGRSTRIAVKKPTSQAPLSDATLL